MENTWVSCVFLVLALRNGRSEGNEREVFDEKKLYVGNYLAGKPFRVCYPEALCPEYSELYDLVRAHNFSNNGLAIADFHGSLPGTTYRGLIATKSRKRGDVLLKVPLSAMLSRLSALESKIGFFLKIVEKNIGVRMLMALHLLYERFEKKRREGIESAYKGYFASLPEDVNSLILFTEEELRELQYLSPKKSTALASVNEMLNDAKRDIDKTLSVLAPIVIRDNSFDQATLSRENLTWAYTIVMSRTFSLKHHQDIFQQKTYLAVPFADLINHHSVGPFVRGYYRFNSTSNCLEFFADQDYPAGSEVLISYGALTNPQLLVSYGFVLTDNVYESIGLEIPIEQKSPAVQNFLKSNPNASTTRINIAGEFEADFIKLLSLKHADSTSTPIDRIADDPYIDFRVRHELLMTVIGLLTNYPTSLEYDIEVLRNRKQLRLSSRAVAAVMFRIEIKRILHVTMIELLYSIRKSFQKSADQFRKDNNPIAETEDWKSWELDIQSWDKEFITWRNSLHKIWNPKMDLRQHFTGTMNVEETVKEAFQEQSGSILDRTKNVLYIFEQK